MPEGYEPLLMSDGALRLADVIEDELILAVPVVPVKPGTEHVQHAGASGADEAETATQPNPFAALKKLKISQVVEVDAFATIGMTVVSQQN